MERTLPPTHREAIRNVFLRRRREYTTQEAAKALRLNLGELLAMVAAGEIRTEVRRKRRQLGGFRQALVSWPDLASFAMQRWTLMQIHDALGKDADGNGPRLLRPVELAVRLPEYQVRLVEALARDAGVSVEAFVHGALHTVESAIPAVEAERLVPGFIKATRFPR